MKTGCFSLPVGNIDHLSCLQKIEHPYERRLRHQYHFRDSQVACREMIYWYVDLREYALFNAREMYGGNQDDEHHRLLGHRQ